ncbi:hypothetical protein [Streptomyces sp. NPDC018693]|uniref:hypothetical protein n=1 Tax=unclassified Streptomyces TaxID=2593676 RepID=UPI0037A0AB60
MPTDEVTHGADAESARERSGPRHAAPKKPLFTRFHMPGGRAIAMAAMPTAVLMGMGFTGSLAVADNNPAATSKELTADEYKACMAAIEASDDDSSESASGSEDKTDSDSGDTQDSSGSEDKPGSSSPDSGSDDKDKAKEDTGDKADTGDKTEPDPSASPDSEPAKRTEQSSSSSGNSDTAPESPSESPTGENLLETIGGAITDFFTGGSGDDSGSDAEPTASPSPSATETAPSSEGSGDDKPSSDSGSGTAKETTDKVTETVKDTAKDTNDTAARTTQKAPKAAEDAADAATASPSPSETSAVDPEDCPLATDDESGVDNKIAVADEPWHLEASSLLLKGARYEGVVQVQTRNGVKKQVLKYVITGGTDIGDLHQIVKDKQIGKTYHVQAGKGTMSTIRKGDTVMYTESISGNLFGLIPVTFSPDSPPPLDIPLIYFTNVKVVQAAQFGGTLTIPGMHQYITG